MNTTLTFGGVPYHFAPRPADPEPARRERPNKRRNLARWRAARARRLAYERSRGYASPRQLARLTELERKL